MAQKAEIARKLALEYPDTIQVCPNGQRWVFHAESELWLSMNGNYSGRSPEEKHELARQTALYRETADLNHEQRVAYLHAKIEVWSEIRRQVLQRDKFTCQVCGGVRPDPETHRTLHVHHILKREEGGTDHYDNLMLVCSKCHRKADTALYAPDWERLPQ